MVARRCVKKMLPVEEKQGLTLHGEGSFATAAIASATRSGEFASKRRSLTPAARARASVSRRTTAVDGFPGLTRRAMRRAVGSAWVRISGRLPLNSVCMIASLVMLAPGLAKEATKPVPTVSALTVMMGIARVASMAARVEEALPADSAGL
jgi:hypothetical protein